MKALVVPWGIQINDIPQALKNIGVEVEEYKKDFSIQTYVEKEREQLLKFLRKNKFDFIISYNFIRQVSDACMEAGIKYVTWIFDSPQIELYTKEALNDCNYIFVFDKKQYERMKERGIKHLFYQPLAANIHKLTTMQIKEQDKEKFAAEISFVGMLYEKNHYNSEIGKFSKENKAYLDSIIMKKALHWGKEYNVFNTISGDKSIEFEDYVLPWECYQIENSYFQELYYIARKVTEIDRICILNGLALSHKVTVFTLSNAANLEGADVREGVSYNEEAPKVYHLSKINLNMTMRSIETGVPQRVFDIMGAGGLVMSNWQEEAEELFEPDKDIVLFHDMEELVYKVNYYLKHEEKRAEIAWNGYCKVKEKYSYERALKRIIECLQRGDN